MLARTGAERGCGTMEPQNHQEESRWPCACAPAPRRSSVRGLPRTCANPPCGCRRLPPRGQCARTFGTAPSGPGTHATGAPAVHTRSRGQRVPAVAVPAEAAVAVTAVVAIQVEVAEVAAKNPKIPCLSNVSERGPVTTASEDRGGARPWNHRPTEPSRRFTVALCLRASAA